MSAGRYQVYIAVSLDGFIATEDGGVGWLDAFQTEGEDYGYDMFYAAVDTLVLGRVTYEQVLAFGAWPYADKPCVVVTQTPLEGAHPAGVVFRSALPTDLAGTVWLVGGRQVIHGYLAAGLVDSIELFVMPVLLGTGIPLFTGGTRPARAALTEHTVYPNGVVRLLYTLNQR